jgi:hypothetical protein
MTFLNTYESHLVGIGEPLSYKNSGRFDLENIDDVTWLPFTQGFSFSLSKQINRLSHLHQGSYEFNRQTNFAVPEVSLFMLDNDVGIQSGIADEYDLFENLGTINDRTYVSGLADYKPLLRDLYTGHSGIDGRNIYFLTDTGQRGRNQIDSSGFDRQLFIIENTFSWDNVSDWTSTYSGAGNS